MYLPVFYYPIQEDDRATGFPDSHLRFIDAQGQIDQQRLLLGDRPQPRRHHLPRLDDQGRSSARRRISLRARARARQGNSRFNWLNEKPVTSTDSGGAAQTTRRKRRLYDRRRSLAEAAWTFSLRGNADYFSSIVTQQSYQQDLYQATNRHRRFGTFTTGTLGGLQVSANADRNDYFDTATSLTTYGAMPRINISRPERPIAGSPVYFGVGGEYVTLLRSTQVGRREDDGPGADAVRHRARPCACRSIAGRSSASTPRPHGMAPIGPRA